MIVKIHTSKTSQCYSPDRVIFKEYRSQHFSTASSGEFWIQESWLRSTGCRYYSCPGSNWKWFMGQRRDTDNLKMPDLSTESLAYLSKIEEGILMTCLFFLFFLFFEIIIIILQCEWRSIVEQALRVLT